MLHQKYSWKSFDNGYLFAQSFTPANEVKAVISFVHGIGEHSSRYHAWFEAFANRGIAVVAFDYRAHGKSFGKRGQIKHYKDIMQDIDVLIKETKSLFPEVPRFLYGHSLGGHLVLNYTVDYQPDLQGLIVTSPWLILPKTPPAIVLRLAGIMHSFCPALRLTTPLRNEDLSSDSAVGKQCEKDPLMHNKISLELFFKAQANNKKLLSGKNIFRFPVALYHGANDNITSPLGSKQLAAHSPKHVTYTEYPDVFHELHNDIHKQDLFDSIVAFVEGNI